jgi:uncharacterized protein (DUF736 family)
MQASQLRLSAALVRRASRHSPDASGQFVIIDAGVSIGAAWRARWDSLVLFTPAPL